MQVIYCLATVCPAIHNQTKSVSKIQLHGDFCRHSHEVTEQRGVCVGHFSEAWYRLFGNDKDMGWGLWCDVMERKAYLILVLYLSRYFPANDLRENRLSHWSLSSFFVIAVLEPLVLPILLSASQRLQESHNGLHFFLQALVQQVNGKLEHP